ncbi:hypothetical protein BCR43DRAFT_460580 [Syncephalastrum racemosum]|uniref:Uncharacterized protein n=1 Tax=Syncephalastrum racemosum TaxID=13706 RepID=A0A1X2H9M5_SYNRA|nr:hypothetical protein BCR43DRAFT_460580 [Syncephalastrum racemosum]
MNDNVYARVRDKVKEANLTQEEIAAIDKARSQLNNYATFGGFVGTTFALVLGRKKKFPPLPFAAFGVFGFLMGSQVGFVSGAMAGVKTINSLPSSQRLINLIKDAQQEIIAGRNKDPMVTRRPPPPAGAAQQPSHHNQEQDAFGQDDVYSQYERLETGFEQEPQSHESTSSWQARANASAGTVNEMQPRKPSAPQQPSAWDKIRAENTPSSTWAKIRSDAQKDPDAMSGSRLANARSETAKELQERSMDSFEELPRTREESEQRERRRKNQYGDPIE